MSVELECAGMKRGLESGDTLTAGKEEGAAGGDPARVIWSKTASGNYAVNMRMRLPSLVPGVEHAEEADLGSKVPGNAGDLQ